MTLIFAARVAACLFRAAVLAGAGAPAVAQGSGDAAPNLQESQTKVPALPPAQPEPEHLFGDWGGVRTYLGDLGINLSLDFTTESAGNISGGLRTGFAYAHQIGLEVNMDWEKLAGLTGFSTHFAAVNRAGNNLSSGYIGDNVTQAQEIYGAGFDMAVHDVWLYGEETLLSGRIDAVFGRIFPGMDFAASPLYCNFMTLTICGHPRALTAEQGFIDWPSNTWGGRLRMRPTPDTYVMGGIYASEPFPAGGRSGFNWTTSHITGAVYAFEAAWEPVLGPNQLPGNYKVGVVYDTSNFPDNYAPVSPGQTLNRTQIWVTFDQLVLRNGPELNSGLTLLAAYAHDSPSNSLYRNFAWAGLLGSGFSWQRPDDQFGFGFTYYQISPSLTTTESLEQEFRLPPTYPYGVQSHAMVFEANYQFAVHPGITIQPEFEFFFRPGGVSSSRVPNAAVLGLKTRVLF